MVIGVLQVELILGDARTLKDKRRVISSLKERLHRSSSVAVAEVGFLDAHQRARLGVATVSNEPAQAQRVLDGVIERMRQDGRFVLSDHVTEIIQGRVGA